MLSNSDVINQDKFAIVGCGSIGKRHLSNLKNLGAKNIIGIEVDENKRVGIEVDYGISTVPNIEEALDQEVDTAIICTPTQFHLIDALRFAEAGCNLFIEKPVSTSLDGLNDLLDIVNEYKLINFVGCNFRFHPGMIYIKNLLRKGEIGKIIYARSQFGHYLPDWHPWEDYRKGYSAKRSLGGGVVLDRIHEIDYLRWLIGDINEVYAKIGRLSNLEIDTEDTAEIMLQFTNGAFGSIHLDYIRRVYDCSMEIVGEEGFVQWNYQDHSIKWYLANNDNLCRRQWPYYDGNNMYLEEMRYFLDALAGRHVINHDIAQGIKDLEVVLAAKQASIEKKVVYI